MRAKRSQAPSAAASQLRNGQGHPFGCLRSYVPLGGGEYRLYQSMREALPILDAAIEKLEKEMKEASKRLEFEYAAVLRDRIIELRGK